MKKIATIFLLALMLFNMAGYRLVFSILENKATENFDLAIDSGDYEESSLVEISVPLNMPYQERHTSFERKYGEIMLAGKVYTYVKMKIEGDVMILKCIPNHNKQQLKNTYQNFVISGSSQDMEHNGKKQHVDFSWIFSSYIDDKNQFSFKQDQAVIIGPENIEYADLLQDVLINIPDQPPRC